VSISMLHISQVGYDKSGLPIGLQFIGRPWSEATLIHLAFAMQVNKCRTLCRCSYLSCIPHKSAMNVNKRSGIFVISGYLHVRLQKARTLLRPAKEINKEEY
jgi:hypothetical protein